MQQGYRADLPDERDLILGASEPVILPSGNWREIAIKEELQATRGFENYGCFPYDARVLMEDFSYKKISEVHVGEYVIAHTGKSRRVISTFKRPYNSSFSYIFTSGFDSPIICTPEHPLFTENGWVNASDLKKGDFILTPSIKIKHDSPFVVENDEDFLWLLGLYLAEGQIADKKEKIYVHKNRAVRGSGANSGSINFHLHKDESFLSDRINSITKRLFGIEIKNYFKKDSLSRTVYLYSVSLRDKLCELGGKGAKEKKLHPRLLMLPPSKQMNIVRGWFAGDGSVRQTGRAVAVTISRQLVEDMRTILLRNKIACSIRTRKAYKNHQESYELHLFGENAEKVRLNGFKVGEGRKHGNFGYKNVGDEVFRRIDKIVVGKNPNQGKNVYNLEVEEDNSYIVNGFAVHNCVSFTLLNALEKLAKVQFGEEWDKSERFTYIASGTDPANRGNSPRVVADSIRHQGVIHENDLPYDDTINTIEKFRSPIPLTQDLLGKGKAFLNDYEVGYRFLPLTDGEVSLETLREALRRSPVAIAVYAWRLEGGVYVRRGEDVHLTLLEHVKDNGQLEVFDSYAPAHKTLSVDFPIYVALALTLRKRPTQEELTTFQTIINLLAEIIGIQAVYVKKIVEARKEEPKPENKSRIVEWANAITLFENAPAHWNNPGAIKGTNGKFLTFSTYDAGFAYLCDYLKRAATNQHKAFPKGGDTTLIEFQRIYSPSNDSNNPDAYCAYVAGRLGVGITIKIKELL